MDRSENGGGEVSEKNEDATEYAINRADDRYYPVIIDREAGGHYEIKNPLTRGGSELQQPRGR
jgi:hypothetical protein